MAGSWGDVIVLCCRNLYLSFQISERVGKFVNNDCSNEKLQRYKRLRGLASNVFAPCQCASAREVPFETIAYAILPVEDSRSRHCRRSIFRRFPGNCWLVADVVRACKKHLLQTHEIPCDIFARAACFYDIEDHTHTADNVLRPHTSMLNLSSDLR